MTIGELARQMGLRSSAVRYYERLGLIPRAPRRAGHRIYGTDARGHLAVVLFARQCGFTIAETKQLLRGFAPSTSASVRWRSLAKAKLRDLDALAEKIRTMRELLHRITDRCHCGTVTQCGRGLLRRYGRRGDVE